MPDLQFASVDDRPTVVSVVLAWVGRLAVIAAFVIIGGTKFNNDPHSEWVKVFDKIGFGQWFRYLAGVMQVGGALLMLSRRTITIGAISIGCTMIGAAITDAVVMHVPFIMIAPLSLLGIVAAIWFSVMYGARR
ncbi:MAG TPA: DoxX family protein [Vicinamibacterales bacterium]|nr:DoxX family protein [Vicinamibacterales bacterium]